MERPNCQDCDRPAEVLDIDYRESYCWECWEVYPVNERGGFVLWAEIEAEPWRPS